MRRDGRCLCGACRFSAMPDDGGAGVCHCSICRTWTGGINMAVECTDVVWNTAAPLRVYRSGVRAERVFCGSNLYWHGVDDPPDQQVIALMAFDEPGVFKVGRQIYIDEKPNTYALADQLQTLTGVQAGTKSA